jgi:hypothetical protein
MDTGIPTEFFAFCHPASYSILSAGKINRNTYKTASGPVPIGNKLLCFAHAAGTLYFSITYCRLPIQDLILPFYFSHHF